METPLEIRRATRKPGELRLPPPLAKATDSLAVLLHDRDLALAARSFGFEVRGV